MSTQSVTVRLDEETVAFLDRLAGVEDRDRSYMVRRAVAEFVELHRWRIEEIERAIEEADAGLFLPDDEAEAFMTELAR